MALLSSHYQSAVTHPTTPPAPTSLQQPVPSAKATKAAKAAKAIAIALLGLANPARAFQFPQGFSAGKPTLPHDPYNPHAVIGRSHNRQEFYVGKAKAGYDNRVVRLWYLLMESQIPSQLDPTTPLEEQAKQAFGIRNTLRTTARRLMSDCITADRLAFEESCPTWEQMQSLTAEKLKNAGITHPSEREVYEAIIESASRSRASINRQLGVTL